MAVTKIKPTKGSPVECLEYTMKNKGMDTEYEIEGITDGIAYAMSDKYDGVYECHTLTSYHNCAPGAEVKTFEKDMANGYGSHYNGIRTNDGRVVVAYHLIQSFDGHETDPETANEIGLRLAKERFKNFACVVSTHTNTNNIHNHIVVCAWDKDGYKYNDCTSTYNEIRRASDRLCEEYNLSVLENTRASVLQTYYDNNGVKRKVEVTDRKIQNWKHSIVGITAISSAADYRHSDAYKTLAAKNQHNRKSIKEDIDALLPHVSSYGELLDRLRNAGYQIKDKKADGDWRVHVTFQAPGQLKGTRDYKLGDGTFYTRESLEEYIAELAVARASDVRVFGNEEMSGTETVSASPVGNTARVNGLQMKVLQDTTDARSSLESVGRGGWVSPDRERQLRDQIKGNVQVLSFIEKRNLHSYEQINGLYKAAYDTYLKVVRELKGLEKEVEQLENAMSIKEKLESAEAKLSGKMASYKDLMSAQVLLESYKQQYQKSGLNISEDIGKIQKDIPLSHKRIQSLKLQIENGRAEIAAYEQCLRTLDRIDRKNGKRNEHALDEYYKIRSQGRYAEKSYTDPPQRERSRGYER